MLSRPITRQFVLPRTANCPAYHELPCLCPRDHGTVVSQAGFTLIELVVAMIIFAVVLALTTHELVGGFGATASIMTTRKAEALVSHAADLMGDDLRSARSHDRNFDAIRQPLLLRKAIMRGDPITHSVTGVTLDVADVKVAEPTRFGFLSNVKANPAGTPSVDPSECILYQLESAGGGWQMARYVNDYAGAGPCGTGGVKTVVIPAQTTPMPSNAFSYTLVCNRAGVNGLSCNGSVPAATPPGSGNCAPGAATSVSGTALNWIMTVSFDLSSLVERAEHNARDQLQDTIALRTRQNRDYLYALGC